MVKRRNSGYAAPQMKVMKPVVTSMYQTEQDTPFGGADFVTPKVAAHNNAARLLEINSTLQAGTPGDWTTAGGAGAVGFPMQEARRAVGRFAKAVRTMPKSNRVMATQDYGSAKKKAPPAKKSVANKTTKKPVGGGKGQVK